MKNRSQETRHDVTKHCCRTREIKIVHEHLEKYWKELFVMNFEIDPNDPSKDIKMQRTNNIPERFLE